MLAKERQLMEVQQTLSGGPMLGTGGEGGGMGQLGARNGGAGLVGSVSAMQAAVGWRPGVGGIVQRPYNQDKGFCVFWDYLLGLPKRSGSKVIGKVSSTDNRNRIPCSLHTRTSSRFFVL